MNAPDDAHSLLRDLPEFAERDQLLDGDGRVLARTIMTPISVDGVNWSGPENVTVRYKFRFESGAETMAPVYLAARHVRDYVCFSAGRAIPLAYIVFGRQGQQRPLFASGFIWFLPNFETHPMKYHPPEPQSVSASEFYSVLESSILRAQPLLERTPPGSGKLSEAIALVGEALWTEEFADSFFLAVRAMNAIVDLDYPMEGKEKVCPACGQRTVSLGNKLKKMIEKRAPGTPAEFVQWLGKRRGVVAHGAPSAKITAEIMTRRGEAVLLARRVVQSAAADLPGESGEPDQ
jgi:hypothetical protein